MTTAGPSGVRFACLAKRRSEVMITSKRPFARRITSSSGRVSHPASRDVVHSCPTSSAENRGITHSSRNSFMEFGHQQARKPAEKARRLVARNRWEVFQELIERIAIRQLVEQIGHGHPRSRKAKDPVHPLRIFSGDPLKCGKDSFGSGHGDIIQCRLPRLPAPHCVAPFNYRISTTLPGSSPRAGDGLVVRNARPANADG